MSDLNDIASDAEYLLHRYDEQADLFHFLPVPRDLHRNCTFITDEHLPKNLPVSAFPRAQLDRRPVETTNLHFIFHSAYCCSTMLARAFDIPGTSMGLKEPVVLNDMIGWARRGADITKRNEVLDQSLALLSRPFDGDNSVIIKASNICTPLAIPMLQMRPSAKALLLYAPIESFLKSIAKKEMWGRIWVRDVLLGTRDDGYLIGGFTADDLLKMTDLQVAAIGWLSQHAAFAKAIDTTERVKTLDSDSFLNRQRETIEALNNLYRLNLGVSDIDSVLNGAAFTSHSKLGQGTRDGAFDAQAREAEQKQMAELHGAEIEMVSKWTAAVADSQGIAMDVGSPLLS